MTGFDTPQHCNGDCLGGGKPVIVDGQCAGATRVAGFRLTGCAGGPGMRYLPGTTMRQAGL